MFHEFVLHRSALLFYINSCQQVYVRPYRFTARNFLGKIYDNSASKCSASCILDPSPLLCLNVPEVSQLFEADPPLLRSSDVNSKLHKTLGPNLLKTAPLTKTEAAQSKAAADECFTPYSGQTCPGAQIPPWP